MNYTEHRKINRNLLSIDKANIIYNNVQKFYIQGHSIKESCKMYGISEGTYYNKCKLLKKDTVKQLYGEQTVKDKEPVKKKVELKKPTKKTVEKKKPIEKKKVSKKLVEKKKPIVKKKTPVTKKVTTQKGGNKKSNIDNNEHNNDDDEDENSESSDSDSIFQQIDEANRESNKNGIY